MKIKKSICNTEVYLDLCHKKSANFSFYLPFILSEDPVLCFLLMKVPCCISLLPQ